MNDTKPLERVMSVHLVCPDADLQALLSFLLRYHDIAEVAAPADGNLRDATTGPTLVVVVDLAEEGLLDAVSARTNAYPPAWPRVVLSRPGPLMTAARRRVPDAAAYLPVPVVPADLLRCLQRLHAAAAVQGYVLTAP
jgi:hypothetical protein